jgi:hypothetical protein
VQAGVAVDFTFKNQLAKERQFGLGCMGTHAIFPVSSYSL